jgi:hypothetical protein
MKVTCWERSSIASANRRPCSGLRTELQRTGKVWAKGVLVSNGVLVNMLSVKV